MIRRFIGIDDTDNLESRGTGHLARQLAERLAANFADLEIKGITRHQLLVDDRIPYTSHNSSACLETLFSDKILADVISFTERFLLVESADGSDVGLCIADWDQVSAEIQAFGSRAKAEILTMQSALNLARTAGVHLTGLSGTHGGVIGALAAIGLRCSGNDGRFLWLNGIREIEGVLGIDFLLKKTGIQNVATESGQIAEGQETVDVGHWVRPVLRDGMAVLLVEKSVDALSDWHVASRDRIKQLSN